MKKLIYIFCFCFLGISANAQKGELGLYGGLNMTSFKWKNQAPLITKGLTPGYSLGMTGTLRRIGLGTFKINFDAAYSVYNGNGIHSRALGSNTVEKDNFSSVFIAPYINFQLPKLAIKKWKVNPQYFAGVAADFNLHQSPLNYPGGVEQKNIVVGFIYGVGLDFFRHVRLDKSKKDDKFLDKIKNKVVPTYGRKAYFLKFVYHQKINSPVENFDVIFNNISINFGYRAQLSLYKHKRHEKN